MVVENGGGDVVEDRGEGGCCRWRGYLRRSLLRRWKVRIKATARSVVEEESLEKEGTGKSKLAA